MVFGHVPELVERASTGGGSYIAPLIWTTGFRPILWFGLGFDRIMLALEAQAEASGRVEVVPGELARPSLLAVVPLNVDIKCAFDGC